MTPYRYEVAISSIGFIGLVLKQFYIYFKNKKVLSIGLLFNLF